MNETATQTPTRRVDVIVVGAGFGGMYAVYRFREMGKTVLGIESGGNVGGVWYWNRYPGARCDLMSVDYSYGFSDEIQQEWSWSEQFAAQPEILAYANFVADRLKLRDNYLFDTRVEAAKWDEASQTWRATLSDGQIIEAPYCIMATGPLSVAKDPDIKGIDSFEGTILRAQKWPHHPVDFTGKRVGVIGTGSSGIQIVQEVGAADCELFVYQRTPSWSLPMRNHVLDEEYQKEMKANYSAMRAAMRLNPTGGTRPVTSRPYFSLPPEQRQKTMEQAWDNGGHTFLGSFSDLLVNQNANDQVADFVRGKIAQTVEDPETAQALMPRGYPVFARRPCLDTGYYETYNQSNVHLKDCLKDPILEITPKGIRTEAGEVELDLIIFATGYDALTGALMAFDVQGRDGRTMTEKWQGGAQSYLGLMVEGFPNMFLTCGPNGPAALANIITISEHDVDWIATLITHMESNGHASAEVTQAGEERWMNVVLAMAEQSLVRKANTWWTGTNVKGKAQGLTMFIGGFAKYAEACAAATANDYEELAFEGRAQSPSA